MGGFHSQQLDELGIGEAARTVLDLRNASNKEKLALATKAAVQRYAAFPGDTGSTPIQIAVMTAKINNLSSHCSKFRQDKHSRRGLQMMYEKRRKLLQYLKRTDFAKYTAILPELKLRPVVGVR